MYQDIYNCICRNTKRSEDILSILSKLQPNCYLKVDIRKVNQRAGGKSNPASTISCKAWNSPAEYPSWVARANSYKNSTLVDLVSRTIYVPE